MGLEEIISNIEGDTKAKVNKILDDAKAEAVKVRQNALKDAEEYTADMAARAQTEVNQLMAREQSRSDIEAKQIYNNTVNKTIDDALNVIKSNLASYAKSEQYQKLLSKLADRAVKQLGNDCIISATKADVAKLAKGKLKAKVVESDEDFSGGIKAVSEDGAMSVDYSLESLVNGMNNDLVTQLMKLIK